MCFFKLGLVDRLPELTHGVLIEGRQRSFLCRIIEEQESPVLLVATARCPNGGIEDLGLNGKGNGVRQYPSHGACRVKSFLEFHGLADYAGMIGRAEMTFERGAVLVEPTRPP